jgi:ubiquitin carboxyl-terminal hydrolase 7
METTTEKDKEGEPIFGDSTVDAAANPQNRPVVLFLKHFDPDQQSLLGIGHFYAAQQDRAADLAPHVLKLLNWPPGTSYKMFEVRKNRFI